jgi:phenylacetate-CoA ligase
MDLAAARQCFPLATPAGLQNLERLRQHPDAPRWTHLVGDHVRAEDLASVEAFRASAQPAPAADRHQPPPALLDWIVRTRARVARWRALVPDVAVLERDWPSIPTLRREDLAARIETLVPEDEPLERLIVYETSGTTGHALRVPHHPRAVAQLHVLAERALAWHGVQVRRGPEAVACMNLHAQARLWVYPSLFSVWGEAAFARLNLSPRDWPGGMASAARFVSALDPGFLSGDPTSLSELLRLDVPARPAALLSTAVALAPPLRRALSERYACPVLDWYSTTETGPIACSKPDGAGDGDLAGLAILAPDLFVELLDPEGRPVPDGARGEITVTGGRNPYLPLLRYRTGDFARWMAVTGPDGVVEWRLADLEGRAAVSFRADDGSPVNPVDVGRALRGRFAVLQHAFTQEADGSCRVVLRPASGIPVDPAQVAAELRSLFGNGTPIEVSIDPDLGRGRDGKVVPYRSALGGAHPP